MQFHDIRPAKQIHKKAKRVGRGGKRGTYSGRGIKGQKARAGRRIRPQLRDVLAKIPKRRGYKVKRPPLNLAVLNLGAIEKIFTKGETVSPKTLHLRGLVRRISGKVPQVKILGGGRLSKPLIFENCLFSGEALKAVKEAGGVVR